MNTHHIKALFALTLLGVCTAHAAIPAPEAPYFLCPSPYTQLTLYWSDMSNNETGFRIETKTETGSWLEIATAAANTTSLVINSYNRSVTRDIRITAYNSTESSTPTNSIRIVGQTDTLEVYQEVPHIRTPRTFTQSGITFSELQDQCPANPSNGKATRVSTFFSVQVRPSVGGGFLDSPTYETRPQIRNFLAQNDPTHTGGHRPYGYGNYGLTTAKPNRTLHNRHWTNFDAAEEVVVRVTLLSTASLPGPINISDLQIHPAPIAVSSVSPNVFDVTLPSAQTFTRHYRIGVNRNSWDTATPDRPIQIFEAPLFIFLNPIQLAPASAPVNQIKEFIGGALVAIGPGIHLPNKNYQFFGSGENSTMREMYAPGDAYLHYGFLFKNDTYALKVWGRAIYSDEMFDVYMEDPLYDFSDATRTPWSNMENTAGNVWNYNVAWEARATFLGSHSQPSTFDGFTNIGTRMGVVFDGAKGNLISHKDIGYGGSTYQRGSTSVLDAHYTGCLLVNDDDITYVHHRYTMDRCTTFNLHNGPSFQAGWGSFNIQNAPTEITNHTILSSDRNNTGYGKNHGVFNSRLDISSLTNHNGGLYENFDFWGKETIVFLLRIGNEDANTIPDTTSIFGDKTYRNFNIRERPYNNNVLGTDPNPLYNKQAYIRFLNFDNLVIAGNPIGNIDDGGFFDYNSGVLLHTLTFFTLPPATTPPAPGTAPTYKISIASDSAGKLIQADASLPVSFSPLCANSSNSPGSFQVVNAGGGYVALRAANGYYIKADPARYGYVHTLPDTARGDADTQSITENAKFIWVSLGGENFALYSKSMGLYLRAEANSGPERPLYAASAAVGPLETFRTIPASPIPPSALAASATGPTTIVLLWTDNSANELNFQLQRSDDGVNGWTTIASPGAGNTSAVDTTVSPGQTYYYRLRSQNSEGDSDWTATVSAITPLQSPTATLLLGNTGNASIISKVSSAQYALDSAGNLTNPGVTITYSGTPPIPAWRFNPNQALATTLPGTFSLIFTTYQDVDASTGAGSSPAGGYTATTSNGTGLGVSGGANGNFIGNASGPDGEEGMVFGFDATGLSNQITLHVKSITFNQLGANTFTGLDSAKVISRIGGGASLSQTLGSVATPALSVTVNVESLALFLTGGSSITELFTVLNGSDGSLRGFRLSAMEVGITQATPPDADSDGLSDADEALIGTDPNDPASFFVALSSHVSKETTPPGYQVSFTLRGAQRKDYWLQKSTTLLPGSWQEVPGTRMTWTWPTSPTNTFDLQTTVPANSLQPAEFFRVAGAAASP